MYRDENGWISQYEKRDALWIHDGNPNRPHALLAAGNHSNGFFNSRPVIEDERLMREAASDLIDKFESGNDEVLWEVDIVVGPQSGATKLAALIANDIDRRINGNCYSLSPAKHEENGVRSMVFTAEERMRMMKRAILLCEDVLTTGSSVELAAAAVADAGGKTLDFILVLVNRSGKKEIAGKKIVALIDRAMPTWTPDECPLCTQGSQALRAKDNWDALNAAYPLPSSLKS